MEPPRDGTGRDGNGRGGPRLSQRVQVSEAGGMRWPGVPLCGLLWMWLPLSCGRPVKIDKVKADTKNLARTLIARIQELQLFPLNLKISGLEFIPGERAPEGLAAVDERLQGFQRVLAGLPAGSLPLAQIANDMENLRSLLAALGAHLGCALPRAAAGPATAATATADLLAVSPYTAAGLALVRLRACLDGIARHLDGLQSC